MQTFLAYPDFTESAKCLDDRRLGNQRNEALVVLKNITKVNLGWKHHPAVKMWIGCEKALLAYLKAICEEYIRRGHPDTVLDQGVAIVNPDANQALPWWVGHEGFHAAHRSSLLRKKPLWYSQFGWTEDLYLPYLWPRSSVGEIVVGKPICKD